jgi:hypothetical protein
MFRHAAETPSRTSRFLIPEANQAAYLFQRNVCRSPAKGEWSAMCFSATASFVTAGVTGAIGIVSLTRVAGPRELPLAATPICFALQQCIEGALWLSLPVAPDAPGAANLTLLFLLFAQVFWPSYVPFAVLLIEPNRRRRRIVLACLALGGGISVWLLWSLLSHSHAAVILDGHVVYVTEPRHSAGVSLAYLAATSLAPVLSSRRIVAALGAIILVGCVVAYVFYWQAFASVWCFFAAAASVLILGYFEQSRRRWLAIAAA